MSKRTGKKKVSFDAKQALVRAVTGQSLANYPTIIEGFLEKNIPESEIKPRENIFSYEVWRTLNRQVRKGEKGVRINTVREFKRKVKNAQGVEEEKVISTPWTAVVFHVSQTDPIEQEKSQEAAA